MEYQRPTKAVPKEQPKTPSSSLRQTSLNHLGVHPLLELQRTIGNQEVLNLLRSQNTHIDASTQAFREPRFGHDFSRIPIHSAQTAAPQTELKVNQPGDVYEQEADQVVEQVMRMTDPEPPVSDEEDEANNSLMRKQSAELGANATSEFSEALPIVHNVLNSGGGQPLDATTRAFMEPRFGHDFSQVRIHTDEQAAKSARAVNAQAYTVGSNVVFGTGQYQPRTGDGRRLMAHELTHIVQQADSNANLVQRLPAGTEAPEAGEGILGASESTSETVTLYHYGDIEGMDSFTSPPGYPRLTDYDIATSQAEASRYTGTPITDKLRYKYEIKIDRAYFEKNFKNTGTRGAYSEFVTRQSIPIRFFRRVLELTPASTRPVTSASGEITVPQRGSVTPSGGTARPVTSASGEITVPQRGSVTPSGGTARPVTSVSGEITPRPSAVGRIAGGVSTAVTVLGSLHLLNQLRDAFEGRVEIQLKDLDPGDFEVGHEFRDVFLGEDDHGTPWYINVRVERNIFFVKQFYAVKIYTIA